MKIAEINGYEIHVPTSGGKAGKGHNLTSSCDCFEYQSCEHDGWEASEAKAFVSSLRNHAHRAVKGYEEAVWGAPQPGRGISLMAMAAAR